MTYSITKSKKLATIEIKDENLRNSTKHFNIKIDFYPILLEGITGYPNCRYGFTEFELDVKISTNGKILNYTKTALVKVSKTHKQETSKDKTTSVGVSPKIPETVSVDVKKEWKSGVKYEDSNTFEDYECELEVLKTTQNNVEWRYKSFPKMQRNELQSFLELFIEWGSFQIPINGRIEMKIIDDDFRGIKEELNIFQKLYAMYILKRQEGVSRKVLVDIYKSFMFNN